MSVSVPGGITIIATLRGGKETEDYLHEKFSQYRVGGEWFCFSEEIRQFVLDVQNNKPGLVPFVDEAKYMLRSKKEYGADAIEMAAQMADAILRKEYKGPGDTIEAAMFRLKRKHGIEENVFKRLRYRQKTDIWAGEYLHLKAVYETEMLSASPKIVRMAAALAGEKD